MAHVINLTQQARIAKSVKQWPDLVLLEAALNLLNISSISSIGPERVPGGSRGGPVVGKEYPFRLVEG